MFCSPNNNVSNANTKWIIPSAKCTETLCASFAVMTGANSLQLESRRARGVPNEKLNERKMRLVASAGRSTADALLDMGKSVIGLLLAGVRKEHQERSAARLPSSAEHKKAKGAASIITLSHTSSAAACS